MMDAWSVKADMSSKIQYAIKNNVHQAHSRPKMETVFHVLITVVGVLIRKTVYSVKMGIKLMVQNAQNLVKLENIEVIMEIVIHVQQNVHLVTQKINAPAAFQDIYFKVMIA